jgi:hypothetical protein
VTGAIDAASKQARGAVTLVRLLRLLQELAEASVVVIAFAVAILVVGTPIALAFERCTRSAPSTDGDVRASPHHDRLVE